MQESRTEYFTKMENAREAMRAWLPMAHGLVDELRALMNATDAKEFEHRLWHITEVTRTLDLGATAQLRTLQDRPIDLHESATDAQDLRDYDLPDSY
jgi:hypothetical protein